MMGRENTIGELERARQDLATLRAEIADAVDTLTRERPPEDATTAELVAELRASVASIDREYADAVALALQLERSRLRSVGLLRSALTSCASSGASVAGVLVKQAIEVLGGGDHA